jgi:hypothetical protein
MSAATAVPTPEQEQRARWDLIILDLEYRAEQVRQIKATPLRIEVLKLTVSAITAAVVLIGGVGAGTIWLLHLAGISP